MSDILTVLPLLYWHYVCALGLQTGQRADAEAFAEFETYLDNWFAQYPELQGWLNDEAYRVCGQVPDRGLRFDAPRDAVFGVRGVADGTHVPAGWFCVEAWTNGSELVLLGDPDALPGLAHRCDEMACGQCHVLFRLPLPQPEAADDRPKHPAPDRCQQSKGPVVEPPLGTD